MTAPPRQWSSEFIAWVRERPDEKFTTVQGAKAMIERGCINAYGGEITKSAVSTLCSEWSHGKVRNAPPGLRYVSSGTYVYEPQKPNQPRTTARPKSKPISNELLEMVGTLPNGDVILRHEDGLLRQYREVGGD